MLPPTVITTATIPGHFSAMVRDSAKPMMHSINRGMIQSSLSPERASSYPLTESRTPRQLSSTHGRKKHNNTNAARLKLIVRARFKDHSVRQPVAVLNCCPSQTKTSPARLSFDVLAEIGGASRNL